MSLSNKMWWAKAPRSLRCAEWCRETCPWTQDKARSLWVYCFCASWWKQSEDIYFLKHSRESILLYTKCFHGIIFVLQFNEHKDMMAMASQEIYGALSPRMTTELECHIQLEHTLWNTQFRNYHGQLLCCLSSHYYKTNTVLFFFSDITYGFHITF